VSLPLTTTSPEGLENFPPASTCLCDSCLGFYNLRKSRLKTDTKVCKDKE
jgi:hypothetical protein